MKAKLEALLRDGHLANQPEFERLHKNYLSKSEKLRKAKLVTEKARQLYDEKWAQGRMDKLFTLEPKTAFLVAKHRKKIAKAELELETARLFLWLDAFLKDPANAGVAASLDKKEKPVAPKITKEKPKKATGYPVSSDSSVSKKIGKKA